MFKPSRKTPFITLASIVTCVFGLAGSLQGAGRYLQVEYPPSAAADELQVGVTYILWIPDGAPRLRGIIVHQHGAGLIAAEHGATAAYDLHWQALAKKWDCALLGPSYHVLNEKTDTSPGGSELWFDPRRGSDKIFLRALGELAAKSGHPELQTVPWVLWGHSGGGIWSNVMTILHPERVAAAFLRSGSAASFRNRPEFPQPQVPAAVYAVPTMCNAGVKEKREGAWNGAWDGGLATFREYRAQGAPIGIAPDPRTAHECGDSRYLAIPFIDACLAMRLPSKGSKDQTLKPVDMRGAWLAPLLGDTAQPAAQYKGNPKEAVWLPNEAVAKAWMEYVKNGTVSDVTMPLAPFVVKAAKGNGGNEITWDAEADFESGIGGFVIMRDGQAIAKLPVAPPPQVYGRLLFQGLSYHDTPEEPIPEMRYVDTSAKLGEKHAYTIISINSAGVPSQPSTEAVVAP
jgi:pimeloyl-ACP methyl ester carboxylesterase